jgi:menaquinone-9 beta-reductase
MTVADVADVAVIGGGIGGASLALALARAGLGVTVLEASLEFEDRVRGETMVPWGVREAQRLGVEETLLAAGAHVAPSWRTYGGDVPGEVPIGLLIEGVPGALNLGHPVACQALLDATAAAGATVVRGVADVHLERGARTEVSYSVDGAAASVAAPLVVGADGRRSTVRKQAGIELDRQEAIGFIAGLLVEGLEDVPDDADVVVTEGDDFRLLFHQGGGRARSYIAMGLSGQHRFAGRDGAASFLEAWAGAESFPWAEQVRQARPAGPCATYAGDDSWTAAPYVDGVVLVGDSAGYNDPIIGQGLSIAMRDARTVRDLVVDGARRAEDFAPYGEERRQRMEVLRLAADLMAVVQVEDAENREARLAWADQVMSTMDPEAFPLYLGVFAGPETVPAELVDDALLDRVRALA